MSGRSSLLSDRVGEERESSERRHSRRDFRLHLLDDLVGEGVGPNEGEGEEEEERK